MMKPSRAALSALSPPPLLLLLTEASVPPDQGPANGASGCCFTPSSCSVRRAGVGQAPRGRAPRDRGLHIHL
jgi:hypothetical protein